MVLIFLEGSSPLKNTILIKMGGVSPLVSEEYVHTARLHTRINNGVFKKPSVMSMKKPPEKKQKNQKIEKS